MRVLGLRGAGPGSGIVLEGFTETGHLLLVLLPNVLGGLLAEDFKEPVAALQAPHHQRASRLNLCDKVNF